jgi:cellobiose phosphorylase
MSDRRFGNAYGHFSQNHREYIIRDPRTPRPWFNYIWNDQYAGLISHTGGGFSFMDDPRNNRLTRMRYNSLPWDHPGRAVMIRRRDTGEYWSLSWAPTLDRDYVSYECRHGQGYTCISTEYADVHARIRYFVPPGLRGEIWYLELENRGSRPLDVDLFSYTEVLMGNALNDLINQPNDKHFTDVHFDRDLQHLRATRRYWVLNRGVSVEQPNQDWPYVLSMCSTDEVKAFDGSLDAFIGRWRSEANPLAIERGQLGNHEITAGEPVLALQTECRLEPGVKHSTAILLSVQDKGGPTAKLQAWRNLERIDAAWQELQDQWDQRLSVYVPETPEPAMNIMAGVWNPYQAAVTFDMARNAGFYHGGLLFGTGMRDQFQDILGVLMYDAPRVRARLLNAMTYQFADGSTLHNFFRLTGTGERTHHSDTPLWIPFGIIQYLKETGEFGFLEERVAFHDQGTATVLEHLLSSLSYCLKKLGSHGLPLIMNGDWNDTLDKVGPNGSGETVWGAMFLGYVLGQSIELLEQLGESEWVEEFRTAYQQLQTSVEEHCWDGEWYLRAFRDDGRPLGTRREEQGRLFLNAQSWAVLSGFASRERAGKALQACQRHLETPYGMQICWPAYRKVDASVGLISRCVPGKKENAAVFNHASAWYVLAALKAGFIEEAVATYLKMLPLNSSADCDRYEIEPYVFAEYVTSPEHETVGQASHSWLTGSAVWMLRIGSDHILGVRPTLNGLLIDPRIPGHWASFSVTRHFRSRIFNIRVDNSAGVNQGVQSLRVNGVESGTTIVAEEYPTGSEVEVEVIMGKEAR